MPDLKKWLVQDDWSVCDEHVPLLVCDNPHRSAHVCGFGEPDGAGVVALGAGVGVGTGTGCGAGVGGAVAAGVVTGA